MLIAPFQKALPILEKLIDNGFEAFFVGGSVRDFLMERPIGDVDIATSARPEVVLSLFPKTIPVGIEHGTVVVLLDGEQYEVTTYRSEGTYEDFRRPSGVEFITSLKEDLSRRDFTINAIAMDKDEQLIDPFEGQQAIANKKIQTVGNAVERFSEDPLRVMRAIRFVSQLDFELEKDTLEGIVSSSHLLANISVERVTIEFQKMMLGRSVNKSILLLVKTNIFQYLPRLNNQTEQLKKLISLDLTPLCYHREVWALLSFILNIQDISGFLKDWKLSNKLKKEVELLVHAIHILQEQPWTSSLLYTLGKELSISAEKIYSVVNQEKLQVEDVSKNYEALPIKTRKELAITGNDLLSWSEQSPGPWMKDLIEKIELAVLDHTVINSKEEIRRWLQSCNQM